MRTINYLAKNNALLLRFNLLRIIGRILVPSYRFKWPQIGWWDDSFFNEYLIRFSEINRMNTDRRWMLYQLMRLVENVPGDTAECGVYNGAGSYLICKVNQENRLFKRTHYLFDSFEGLSKPLENDGNYWKEGDLSCSIDFINKTLSEFSNISIHKGWIPQRFEDIKNNKFCFVHIDVDLYDPTLDSIEFFYPRMHEGGIIVCDDYEFKTCPGATEAIDQFLQDKKEKMISLSGGGGFIVKGINTSERILFSGKHLNNITTSVNFVRNK